MSFWLGPWMGFPLLAETDRQQSEKPSKFQVSMHLGHYEPGEVVVKVSDNLITVRAEHEERTKDGYSFSRTVRQITAPEDARVDQLTSRLTSSGHLKLEAPLRQKPAVSTARNIPIMIEGLEGGKQGKDLDGGDPLRITYDNRQGRGGDAKQ